jgi:hypothetical protein
MVMEADAGMPGQYEILAGMQGKIGRLSEETQSAASADFNFQLSAFNFSSQG